MKPVWLIRCITLAVGAAMVLFGAVLWWLLALLLAYICLMAWIAFHPNTQIFSPCYYRHQGSFVSLSFDDGPHPDTTPELLQLLAKHQIKATFFLVGSRAEAYPELVQQIAAEGHEIGNHSFTHSYLISLFSKGGWDEELASCQRTLFSILGYSPLIYRPPYGVSTPNTVHAAARHSLQQIGWSCHGRDFFGSVGEITQRLRGVKRGDIVLLHETKINTISALADWLASHQASKLDFTTVSHGAK